MRPEPSAHAHRALEHDRPPRKTSVAFFVRGEAGAAGWGHLYALRVALAAAADHQHAISCRRRALASAGGAMIILAALALLATTLLAETASGHHLLVSVHLAVAPGLAFDYARPLLIVATALTIATASTWLMLAVLAPSRKATRRSFGLPTPKPRSGSWMQRHRAVVLGAGIAPVLLGGGHPFLAHLLPLGLRFDANSAVGTSLLDVIIGLAVPGTVLSVLYFRWIARLASAELPDSQHV